MANNISLIEILDKSSSDIRWDPYRKKGVIYNDDLSISFMLDSTSVIINYSKVLSGFNFLSVNGEITVNNESAKVLYRLLSIKEEKEELFNIPVIILDPGHGGRDSGALGNHESFNIQEKDVVLNISHKVAQRLNDNYPNKKILMTRSDDSFLSLEERVELANGIEINNKEAVIYISVHANASLKKKAQGFEVWYLPKGYRRTVIDDEIDGNIKLTNIVNAIKEDEISLEGETLAKSILDGIATNIEDVSSNRGLKEEIWFVVRKARMASVLIEVGFVTNEVEGSRLKEEVYLQKVADGIYNGITEFVTSYEKNGR